MTKPIDNYSPSFLMTKAEYLEEAKEMLGQEVSAHTEVTRKFITELEFILRNCQNFKQIKNAITGICEDRKEFLSFVDKNNP